MTHSNPPESSTNPLYTLLQDEDIKAFNAKRTEGGSLDFSGCLFRGLDLRNINADGANFSNAYFRGADLRGIDFSNANLVGASIAEAKISGCYFPAQLSPQEIRLSQEKGCRMRYQPT